MDLVCVKSPSAHTYIFSNGEVRNTRLKRMRACTFQMWPLRIEGNCFYSDLCIMPASCMNLLPAGKIYNASQKLVIALKFIQLHGLNLYNHQLAIAK